MVHFVWFVEKEDFSGTKSNLLDATGSMQTFHREVEIKIPLSLFLVHFFVTKHLSFEVASFAQMLRASSGLEAYLQKFA